MTAISLGNAAGWGPPPQDRRPDDTSIGWTDLFTEDELADILQHLLYSLHQGKGSFVQRQRLTAMLRDSVEALQPWPEQWHPGPLYSVLSSAHDAEHQLWERDLMVAGLDFEMPGFAPATDEIETEQAFISGNAQHNSSLEATPISDLSDRYASASPASSQRSVRGQGEVDWVDQEMVLPTNHMVVVQATAEPLVAPRRMAREGHILSKHDLKQQTERTVDVRATEAAYCIVSAYREVSTSGWVQKQRYKCGVCNHKGHADRRGFERHFEKEHTSIRYLCSHCGKDLARQDNCRRHEVGCVERLNHSRPVTSL